MNKKRKTFIFDPDQKAKTGNARAVKSVLNRKRKTDPDTLPTRTQLQDPLPGQQSLFDADPQSRPQAAFYRRKSAEKVTKHKQLLITPTARQNLLKRASAEDISINSCLNALMAAAIRSGLQVKRDKAGEPKTCRQIAIFTPSLLESIENTAAAQGVSLNEFICFALENSEKVIL